MMAAQITSNGPLPYSYALPDIILQRILRYADVDTLLMATRASKTLNQYASRFLCHCVKFFMREDCLTGRDSQRRREARRHAFYTKSIALLVGKSEDREGWGVIDSNHHLYDRCHAGGVIQTLNIFPNLKELFIECRPGPPFYEFFKILHYATRKISTLKRLVLVVDFGLWVLGLEGMDKDPRNLVPVAAYCPEAIDPGGDSLHAIHFWFQNTRPNLLRRYSLLFQQTVLNFLQVLRTAELGFESVTTVQWACPLDLGIFYGPSFGLAQTVSFPALKTLELHSTSMDLFFRSVFIDKEDIQKVTSLRIFVDVLYDRYSNFWGLLPRFSSMTSLDIIIKAWKPTRDEFTKHYIERQDSFMKMLRMSPTVRLIRYIFIRGTSRVQAPCSLDIVIKRSDVQHLANPAVPVTIWWTLTPSLAELFGTPTGLPPLKVPIGLK